MNADLVIIVVPQSFSYDSPKIIVQALHVFDYKTPIMKTLTMKVSCVGYILLENKLLPTHMQESASMDLCAAYEVISIKCLNALHAN